MEEEEKLQESKPGVTESPFTSANCLSAAFFCWLNDLLTRGSQQPLEKDDLYPIPDDCKSENLISQLEIEWQKEQKRSLDTTKSPNLWKAIARLIPVRLYIVVLLFGFLSSVSSLLHPLFLGWFIELLGDSQRTVRHLALCILGLAATAFSKRFFLHHSNFLTEKWGMRIRVAIIGLIYRKVLVLNSGKLSRIGTGHIINLISNDVQLIERTSRHLQETFLTPFDIIASLAILWIKIGREALVGVLIYFLVIALNMAISSAVSKLRLKAALLTDKRLGLMGEIIHGIRSVKMNIWEWKYSDKVMELRRKEIRTISFIGAIGPATINAMFRFIQPFATFLSVLSMVLVGVQLTPPIVFVLLAYMSQLRYSVCVNLGEALIPVRQFGISMKRFSNFLMETTIENKALSWSGKNDNQTAVLRLSGVTCTWDEEVVSSALNNVTLDFRKGQTAYITGPVGSGKSSLLMAILGELPVAVGEIFRQGNVAYTSQTPWMFSGTVQQNVLFGRPLNFIRYQSVLEACDLLKDIESFPKRDMSMIGQRGVTLSGGQRARLSLARAIYSEADIYLLDDPLSAVDATVGRKIFEKIIQTLLRDKLTLLVTHQVQFLKGADYIVVLNEGRVASVGTYSEVVEKKLLNGALQTTAVAKESNNQRSKSEKETTLDAVHDFDSAQDLKEEEEDRSSGSVTYKLYWRYIRAGMPIIGILLWVILLLIGQVSLMAPSWWLSRMSEMSTKEDSNVKVLCIYGGLVVGAVVLQLIRSYFQYWMTIRAATKLHNEMNMAVIKAPVLFFDTNPAGRILNRFSKDMASLDDPLPEALLLAVPTIINYFSSTLFPLSTSPWIVLIVFPLLALFFYYGRYYLKTSRELMRLQAQRCSPIYSHMAETIAGINVIRPSNMEENFNQQFYRHLDSHSEAFFLIVATTRWLCIRLDSLGSMFITAVAIVSLLFSINPVLAGLVLVFIEDTLDGASYGVRCAADVENLMTSVERVVRYTELEPEQGYALEKRPPSHWPEEGKIQVNNLSLVYYEGGREVLKNISFKADSKEKIAVVGRTGAGKSSLVAAFFRLVEPRGEILIDQVNTLTLNIQCCRRAMSVITQDPVLFSGSLRRNLDPFGSFEDSQLWTSLEEVGLKSFVQGLPGNLDYQLADFGSNFSAGERQLLCLARALLQKNKIIIMDEATANVDFETDQSVQRVIRSKCGDCTVITIAHRLSTVMDYDKVMVLHHGQMLEFDSPDALLSDEESAFSQLVKSHTSSVQETETEPEPDE